MTSGKWASSNRKNELPSDWSKRVATVKRRSGGRCELILDGYRCLNPGRDVDHWLHRDDHRIEALKYLCQDHHKAKTAAEAVAAQPRRQRPATPHPGLLSSTSTSPGGGG